MPLLCDLGLTSLCLVSTAYIYLLHYRRNTSLSSSPSKAYILTNQVTHARLLPATSRHAFSYHTLSLLLSLSDLENGLLNVGWGGTVFGYPGIWGRVCGLRPGTYGLGGATIRDKLIELLQPTGMRLGEAWMMTMPSFLGFEGINPLTVYFCYEEGRSDMWGLVLEVHNTFGERHAYVLQVGKREDSEEEKSKEYDHQWTFPRQFHVSPFNDRAGHYVCSVIMPSHPPSSTSALLSLPRPVIRLHLLTSPPIPRLKLVALLRPVLSEPLSARTLLASLVLPPFTSGPRSSSPQAYLDSDVPKPSPTSWSSLPLGAALLLTSLRIVYQAARLHYQRGLAVFARPEPVAGAGREWVEKALGGVWNDIQPTEEDVAIGRSIGWQSESSTERFVRQRFERWIGGMGVAVRIASADPTVPIAVLGNGTRELTICYRSPRVWTCILLAPNAEYALEVGSKVERWFSVSDEGLFCELWELSGLTRRDVGWIGTAVSSIRARLSSAMSIPFPGVPYPAHPLDEPASPALLLQVCLLYITFHAERLVFSATGARFVKGDTPWRISERLGRRARVGAGGVGSVTE